jgi:hypothetical protein
MHNELVFIVRFIVIILGYLLVAANYYLVIINWNVVAIGMITAFNTALFISDLSEWFMSERND